MQKASKSNPATIETKTLSGIRLTVNANEPGRLSTKVNDLIEKDGWQPFEDLSMRLHTDGTVSFSQEMTTACPIGDKITSYFILSVNAHTFDRTPGVDDVEHHRKCLTRLENMTRKHVENGIHVPHREIITLLDGDNGGILYYAQVMVGYNERKPLSKRIA